MSEYENMQCAADQIARAIRESIAENLPNMRDYFAAQALVGLLATYAGIEDANPTPVKQARMAYDFAEAMLAERSKRMGAS